MAPALYQKELCIDPFLGSGPSDVVRAACSWMLITPSCNSSKDFPQARGKLLRDWLQRFGQDLLVTRSWRGVTTPSACATCAASKGLCIGPPNFTTYFFPS